MKIPPIMPITHHFERRHYPPVSQTPTVILNEKEEKLIAELDALQATLRRMSRARVTQ